MAGRIPQDFIDQLINRIDIVDLIDGYVPLKKAGANYKACCPFHNEKSPSFTVSPSKQFYHCFGCGANGTAISFLMDYDHMEFLEAIEKLASGAGLEIPTDSHQTYTKPVSTSAGIDLYQLMQQITDYFQKQLLQHPDKQQAIEYLKRRGLSGQTVKRFSIGFAPDGWDNLMSEHGSTTSTQKALLDTGMLTQNDKQRVYDRFRHRIMFPIHDHRGRVVGFGGRVLGDGEPKYLNSPETPIFHKGAELYGLFAARGGIKDADGVLVVEGYMDVVALAHAGIDNAVATLGTATTPMHLQRLFRHTHNITFSFDGDRAGKAAAWKALQTSLPLLQDGHQISFLFLPDGEDPDSMVAKIGKDGFLALVSDAMSLPDFLINTLRQQADLNRLDGRAKLAKLSAPILQIMPNGILRQLVVEQLARLSQITPQDLLGNAAQASNKSGNTKDTSYSAQGKQKTSSSKPVANLPMTPIRRAISMLLQQPSMANNIPDEIDLSTLKIKGIELLRQLIAQAQSNSDATTATLIERHRQESHFPALEKLASHDHLFGIEQFESAFFALLEQLKALSVEAELEQLIEKSKHEPLNQTEKQQLSKFLTERQSDS